MPDDIVRDRVNELYRGEIFEFDTQQTCRDRIHWMCSQVTGNDVLDIGCSQGITSLLLGREGHRVVGVDIDPAAIQYAQSELERETEYVRRSVEFRCVGSETLPFADESFDSILMGELLEHLTRPERLLAETRRLVRANGRVIITTPFGLLPHPGHVRTFYLTSFLSLVSKFFGITNLHVLGGYIACTATKSSLDSDDEEGLSLQQVLLMSEAGFLAKEEQHWVQRQKLSHQRQTLKNELAKTKEQTAAAEKNVAQISRSLQEARAASQGYEQHIQILQGRIETLENERRASEILRERHVADLVRAREEEFKARIEACRKEQQEALEQAEKNYQAQLRASIETLQIEHAQSLQQQHGALEREKQTVHAQFEARLADLKRSHETELQRHIETCRKEHEKKLVAQRQAHQKRINEMTARHQNITAELRQYRDGREQRLHQLLDAANRQSDSLRQRLATQQEFIKGIEQEHLEQVRYQLGDALVRTFDSPHQLIRLPGRMFKLLACGLRRRRARRELDKARLVSDRSFASSSLAVELAAPAPQPAPAISPTRVEVLASSKGDSNGNSMQVAMAAPSLPPPPPPASPKVEFVPVSPPNRPPRLSIKAAVIMDEFTYECFRPECHLLPITPQDWKAVLKKSHPDFLFVESAWKGNDGTWQYKINHPEKGPLPEIIKWCRSQGIPTVFWNKEDPPNFEHFIEAAKLFDYIFTTDANCIPRYREQVTHNRVYALPFAAQPAIHNPVNRHRQLAGKICFSGSYYANRHASRQSQMDVLLRPALSRGLHIFDRNAAVPDPRYTFPAAYQSAIRGALPYPQMVDAYKKYSIFLNVNSVDDSPTMFSRRVFEILACGTPVISTYATGIADLLGPDCVALIRDEEEASGWMDRLLTSPDLADRMVQLAHRRIFGEHTYEHRLRTILEKIGKAPAPPPRRISIVTATNRPEHLELTIANYERQNAPEKELILILNSDSFSLASVRERLKGVPNARAYQLKESCSLGECLNRGIDEARYEYWTKFDDDNYYAEHFVSDLMLPYCYADAPIVGKNTYYAYLEGMKCLALRYPGFEHQYVKFLSGSAMIVESSVFKQVRFPEQNRGEDTVFLQEAQNAGFKIYSADRFNYVCRRAASVDRHTWKITAEEFLKKCRVECETDDYRPHVTL